jgi:NADPH:quinone reductase-like Zn-dependent oxidoreductase
MKAFQIQNTFGLDSLNLVDLPDPKPGPGQVLVRVRAASLNFRDLLTVKGLYNPRMPLPRIPFSDGAGEVVATGAGVTRVKPGDRVAGIFMQTWLGGRPTAAMTESALGGAIDGMLAEQVVLHEDGLVHIPAHLSYEEASTLPCAAVTAWNALFCEGRLQPGHTVLVQGTGGVSIFALQFARMVGARVIATSSSDEKLARARALGASEGINYRTTPDWEKKVWELTGREGVDHVIEVGGAGTINKSLQCLRLAGTISMIGVLAGGSAEVRTVLMLHKYARVQGIYVGSREMFEGMNRAIAGHALRPVVDRVFPFTEARQALRHMESAAHFGKIVLSF